MSSYRPEFGTPERSSSSARSTCISSVGRRCGSAPIRPTICRSCGRGGRAWRAGVGGILQRGKAELGDKTMYDAWAPALDAYDAAVAGGSDLAGALTASAEAAAKGRVQLLGADPRGGADRHRHHR
ncbi:dihydroxyacetone kinase family protein [Kribbella sp. NBC_00359]|uniref:dihydroxyacetone kinase family protein n=1 Tax=Kribbella sp. NBC_00359 TaxID=2975966 RepID=UPI002E1B0DB4